MHTGFGKCEVVNVTEYCLYPYAEAREREFGNEWMKKVNDDSGNQRLEKFSNFLIFQTETGKVNIDVYFRDETLWLTQKKIAELFEKDRSVITKHLKNLFSEEELSESSVCANFAHTAEDGKTYNTRYYNLKAITAVGYRVNSYRATEFRKWATDILHEYIIKGFVMDDEPLKQNKHFSMIKMDSQVYIPAQGHGTGDHCENKR